MGSLKEDSKMLILTKQPNMQRFLLLLITLLTHESLTFPQSFKHFPVVSNRGPPDETSSKPSTSPPANISVSKTIRNLSQKVDVDVSRKSSLGDKPSDRKLPIIERNTKLNRVRNNIKKRIKLKKNGDLVSETRQ